MDEADRLAEYDKLRQLASRLGMQWVLDELDDAVSLGVIEVKQLRQVTRRGQMVYEEVPAAVGATGRKRAEEFLERRSLTPEERVRALIGALRRVVLELDDVATSAVEQVNEALRMNRGVSTMEAADVSSELPQAITETDFELDEGARESESLSTEGRRHRDLSGTMALSGLIDTLESELLR